MQNDLERLLADTATALETGDPETAANLVAVALDLLAAGTVPADPAALLSLQSDLLARAEEEATRLSRELALLGNSRRAAGAYRGI
jgi:hypothetical protein